MTHGDSMQTGVQRFDHCGDYACQRGNMRGCLARHRQEIWKVCLTHENRDDAHVEFSRVAVCLGRIARVLRHHGPSAAKPRCHRRTPVVHLRAAPDEFQPRALRLLKVEVWDENGAAGSFEGDELAQRLSLGAVSRASVQPVRPGERAIVYLEVQASTQRPPRVLRHRVGYATDGRQEAAEVSGGEVAVSANSNAALWPPLRGGPWTAVYAWEWPRGHRRVFYTIDGRARLPGRFAIDWVMHDKEGNSARGDADVVKNSLGYGADVLAVANARVAAVRDGIAEALRVSANPKHSLDEAAGNYVALDIGGGRFAYMNTSSPAASALRREIKCGAARCSRRSGSRATPRNHICISTSRTTRRLCRVKVCLSSSRGFA